LSRRSTSTESLTHIPLVDDKSLDSASDNNTDLERQQQRRRQIKPKKKDVETNTDQAYDSSQQEHSFFDDKGKKRTKNTNHSFLRCSYETKTTKSIYKSIYLT